MGEPFTSIHHPIGIDAGLGRLRQESNYSEHVEQLMKQVLFTGPGERINRPDFGCGLRRMVFAPNSDATASLVQVTVLQALEKWLDSVIKVDEVQVEARDELLEVKIRYSLRARPERRVLNVEVGV